MSPAPALDRRTILPYAVGFDLVIIAIGVGLLLPSRSGLTVVPFIVAVGLAASRGGWKVGLATTAFSIVSLLLAFDGLVPLPQITLFTLTGLAASALLGTTTRAGDATGLEHAAEEELIRARVAEISDRLRDRAVPALMHVGLPVLVLVVYLNLSSILVEQLSVPSVLQPLILVLAGLVLHYRHAFRPASTIMRPVTLTLIGYCLVVFASGNWAHDIAVADAELRDLVKGLMLVVVAGSLAASWRAVRGACVAMVCGAALLSVIALVQVAIGDPELQFGGFAGVDEGHLFGEVSELRPAGPVRDPNYFARILLIAFPVAAFLGVGRRSLIERAAYAMAAAVIALGILFTYSRGAMLTLVALGFLLVMLRRVRLNWVTVVLIVAGVAALIPTTVGKRFLTIEELITSGPEMSAHVDASADKRRHLLIVGWNIFADHPLTGVGAGNFGSHYVRYANVVGLNAIDFTPAGLRQYPHNLYLEMATETGLLGLSAFLGAMAVALITLYRSRRVLLDRGEHARAALVASLALSIAGYLVSSLFLHSGYPRYLWLMVGLGIAAIRLTNEARPAGDDVARADDGRPIVE